MKTICDWHNCNKIGEYKAPVEKDNSKKYRLLCLEHIKELKYHNLKKYFNKKSVKTIVNFMARDKKNYSKNINLILLKRVSKPLLNNTYPKIKIEKFLNTLINK